MPATYKVTMSAVTYACHTHANIVRKSGNITDPPHDPAAISKRTSRRDATFSGRILLAHVTHISTPQRTPIAERRMSPTETVILSTFQWTHIVDQRVTIAHQ